MLDFQFIFSLLYLTCLMITISSELYTKLLVIIYYFTVAESELEASAQVNRKRNVNLVHAEMLQVSLSLLGAKICIIKQHSDIVYFNNAMLFFSILCADLRIFQF